MLAKGENPVGRVEEKISFSSRGVSGRSRVAPTRLQKKEKLEVMIMKNKENRKRPIQKLVRFNSEEFAYVESKISKSPINNFQNFARLMLITGEVKMIDYSELHKLNAEINRIGNNINQIARLANQFEEISAEDVHALLSELETIKQLVKNTLAQELREERMV